MTECLHDVLLADDFGPSLRAVFAVEGLGHFGNWRLVIGDWIVENYWNANFGNSGVRLHEFHEFINA
jgi:hypothetical protein